MYFFQNVLKIYHFLIIFFSSSLKINMGKNPKLRKKPKINQRNQRQNKMKRLLQLSLFLKKLYLQQASFDKKSQKKNFEMMYREETKSKLTDRIFNLFSKQSYVLVSKSQKQVSSQIMYFLKCLQYSLTITEQIDQILQKCMNAVFLYIKASQRQKCLHKFLLFMFITEKYGILTGRNYQPKPQQLNIFKNKKSQSQSYLKYLQQFTMTEDQSNSLKSQKINDFIIELTKNQVKLQNNQCICCSEVFVRGHELKNFNPFFQKVIEIPSNQSFQNFVIVKYINAICNQGGGVILIGVEKKNDLIFANGIKFKDQECIDSIQQQIQISITNMRPKCNYRLQRVLVHTKQTKKLKVAQQFMRICFRIIVFPVSLKKLTYSQLSTSISDIFYESYILDHKNFLKQISPENIYQKMHKIFREGKQQLISCHKNIMCFRPYPYYSKIFYEMYNNGDIKTQQLYPDEDSNSSDEQFCQQNLTDDPKFKFRYQSLIVVPSHNADKNVEKFIQYLINQKIQNYHILKPYVNSFVGKKMRSVWLISHSLEYSRIRELLKDFTKRLGNSDCFTIMPIQQILQIKASKFTKREQKILKQKLLIRYNDSKCFKKQETLIYDKKEQQNNRICYIKFKNKYQSLFAYLIFQQLNLRPYFVNQENCCIKF